MFQLRMRPADAPKKLKKMSPPVSVATRESGPAPDRMTPDQLPYLIEINFGTFKFVAIIK